MFTGIIENIGSIIDARAGSTGRRLRIDAGSTATDCRPGESVAVSGVCLTVTSSNGSVLEFDVIPETLARSTLGLKKPGDRVNLERALRLGDRLSGHFVQGHVDGVATVERISTSSGEYVLWLTTGEETKQYIVPKGSIAVDGVSLTVARMRGDGVAVALIPATLERTTLSLLRRGDRVNIEADVVSKTVIDVLLRMSEKGTVTLEGLRRAGFA